MSSPVTTPVTTPRARPSAAQPRSPESTVLWLGHVITHSQSASQEDLDALSALAQALPRSRECLTDAMLIVIGKVSIIAQENIFDPDLYNAAKTALSQLLNKRPERSPIQRDLNSPYAFFPSDPELDS